MKSIFFIVFLIPVLGNGQSKSDVDSVLINFLRSKPNIPTPVLKIEKVGKTETINRNYYWQAKDEIRKDSIRLTGYVFGTSASHGETYFMLKVFQNKKVFYQIIEERNIKQAIDTLLRNISEYKLTNSQQAILINQLTTAYF